MAGFLWNWRWIKAARRVLSLYELLKTLPDFRCRGKIRHDQAEVLCCFILGTLAGKTKVSSIIRWCRNRTDKLRKYMELKNGIASAPTFSRILAGVDEELLSGIFTQWMMEMYAGKDQKAGHISIDGKGLRGAVRKIREERTPYVLNAIDVGNELVLGQMAIPDKSNEKRSIPEFLHVLPVKDSTITIDAIGTTGRIMNTIAEMEAHFVLQVKKDNPDLYNEIMILFHELDVEKEKDPGQSDGKEKSSFDEWSGSERSRERNEYRRAVVCSDADEVKAFRSIRPLINSIGYIQQIREKKICDKDGNDITPDLKEFLKHGSIKQPAVWSSNEADTPIQKIGIISDLVLKAEEMARYKRDHWAIENKLHYVLDETLGEDKSTIRKGKINASLLRKVVYNIVRLWMKETKKAQWFSETIEEIGEDWTVVTKYIFKPVKAI